VVLLDVRRPVLRKAIPSSRRLQNPNTSVCSFEPHSYGAVRRGVGGYPALQLSGQGPAFIRGHLGAVELRV